MRIHLQTSRSNLITGTANERTSRAPGAHDIAPPSARKPLTLPASLFLFTLSLLWSAWSAGVRPFSSLLAAQLINTSTRQLSPRRRFHQGHATRAHISGLILPLKTGLDEARSVRWVTGVLRSAGTPSHVQCVLCTLPCAIPFNLHMEEDMYDGNRRVDLYLYSRVFLQ
jgi:hypothetical protein